ncbi:hypothetical protein [Methyloglobulus sp.]|uniref:hypothetical protein n=1 Tax=Methyloglobulus sp. TaxID=2518622 RepID=UPI0032B85B8E
MKKLLLGAAASAALFVGAANAAVVPALPAGANVYTLTVSGASASQAYFEKYLTGVGLLPAKRLCAGAVTKHVDALIKDQFAYSCAANKVGNPTLAAAMGIKTVLLIKKRTDGGSGYGVGPVAADAAIPFLGGSAKPDFGLSDLAPSNFTSAFPYNAPAGVPGFPLTAAAIAAKLTVLSAPRQVFGVVVNTAFRNALQKAQGKVVGNGLVVNMPSLTKAQITSFIKTGTSGTLTGVYTCGRTNGSGTKAATAQNICGAAGTACQGTPATRYFELSASSGVSECLSEINQGVNTLGTKFNNAPLKKGFAIGYQSTDVNALPPATQLGTLGQYSFIKVNGVEPTLVKAAAGSYIDVSRSTCQYNKTAAAVAHLPVAKKALITQICQGIGNVAVINAVNPLVAKHTWGQAGFLP